MRPLLFLVWCGCTFTEVGFADAYERERCWYLSRCEAARFDADYDDLGDCTSEVDARAAELVAANAACTFDVSAGQGCLALLHKLVDNCMDHTREATAERCDEVWTCADGGAPGAP